MIRTEKKYIAQDNPYKNLALAIVERAVYDYRIAKKSKDYETKHELYRFFTSDWFKMLCDIDGKLIVKTLELEEDVA
ncbi:MAG: hypothetical protein IJN43_08950 [Ruminococcus sp.]|nr:hypothetical protein [Ruminococcus sp.]